MKRFARLTVIVVAAMALAMSCSKDKDSGKITFDSASAYISSAGGSVTMGFTTSNIKVSTITVSTYPKGWDEPVLDPDAKTVTITAPADLDAADTDATGTVTLTGKTPDGTTITSSPSLFVGVIPTVDMTGKPANCYLVSQKETNYKFETKRPDGTAVEVDHIAIVWATSSSLLQYLTYNNGEISFYVGASSDDDTAIKEGNALIGAYDANKKLLWSWHVWSSNYDIEGEALAYTNGYTVMSRNLGALDSDNSTTAKILASYGLYYQWGRKDPFVGPSAYTAANGSSVSVYDSKGTRVYITTEGCTSEIGTDDYARQNPLVYITGTADSNYDWLYGGPSNSRWAATKTVNDPCPYGWHVAPAAAFDGLTIVDDLTAGYATYEQAYGWTLTDGTTESFYLAGGFRRYDNGKIQNIFNPVVLGISKSRNEAMEAQPWEGLFWTTDTNSSQAAAFYFWFNKSNVTASGVSNSVGYPRADGMQVRCVKE